MDKRVQTVILMLMMLSLSFFIYIFMVPAQHIRSEHNNYGANITEAEEVIVERERSGIVPLVILIAGTIRVIVFVYKERVHRHKKKAQESSSVPQAEELAERYT